MIYEAEDCNDIEERANPFKDVYKGTKIIISQNKFWFYFIATLIFILNV